VPTSVPTRFTRKRVLLASGIALIGFLLLRVVSIALDLEADLHFSRLLATFVPLFAWGAVLVRPGTRTSVRGAATVLGFAAAWAAWMYVPTDGDGWSLHHAKTERNRLRDRFAGSDPTEVFEDGEREQAALRALKRRYPALARGMDVQYAGWLRDAREWISARYRQLPPDDLATARLLRAHTEAVLECEPAGEFQRGNAIQLERAFAEWLARAVTAKQEELFGLRIRDWEMFDRTAPGRRVLAEAFPECRAELVAAEEDWVELSAVGVTNRDAEREEKGRFPTEDWPAIEKAVLALKSLDTGDGRFTRTRRSLFADAHGDVQWMIAAHLKAGRYDLAFGLARRHAVEWNATAAVLGPEELKKLDSLRETCEKLAAKAAPPDAAEVAPPPRPKP
jgi:hypothetical protein